MSNPGERRRCIVHRAQLFAAAAIALSAASASASSLETVVDDLVQDRIDRQVESNVLDHVERAIESGLEHAVAPVSAPLERIVEILPSRTEAFQPEIDSSGSVFERGVWLVLATPEHVGAIEREGFTVRELRKLTHLGRVLVRVEAPASRVPEDADLALDRNHVYRAVAGPAAEGGSTGTTSRVSRDVTVGIVDSEIATRHDALRRAAIEQRDFVGYDRPRPQAHGTAVASILVGDAGPIRGLLRGARLFAASVFFQDDAGESAATTASLVRALDWLTGTGTRVINMSLAGPPNRVLEAAIDAVAARGIVVTAAVGNDGPTVKPRYPAAYEKVAGITAVDAAHGIYLHANRGPGVMFAAPGVGIGVALAGGGFGSESGTSYAAAHAASILARAIAEPGATRDQALAKLAAAAIDLGEPGFDETFGHGLIKAPE